MYKTVGINVLISNYVHQNTKVEKKILGNKMAKIYKWVPK
jgi:hypothetical protein